MAKNVAGRAKPRATRSTRSAPYDPQAQISELQGAVTELCRSVRQIAEVNAMENVICTGLSEICERLDRCAQPQQPSDRVGLPDATIRRLMNLRCALRRPNWSGASYLPVRDLPLTFIGAAVLPPPPPDGRPDPFSCPPLDPYDRDGVSNSPDGPTIHPHGSAAS